MYCATSGGRKCKIKRVKSEREEAKGALFEFVSCTAGTKKQIAEHRLHAEKYSRPHTDIIEEVEKSLE